MFVRLYVGQGYTIPVPYVSDTGSDLDVSVARIAAGSANHPDPLFDGTVVSS